MLNAQNAKQALGLGFDLRLWLVVVNMVRVRVKLVQHSGHLTLRPLVT